MAALIFSASPLFAAEIVFEGDGERLVIQGEALKDVAPYAIEGGHSIIFRLSEEDGAAFGALTDKLIGRVLTMSICGEVVAEPLVRDRLSGSGIVPLPDAETAVAYTAALKGDTSCP